LLVDNLSKNIDQQLQTYKENRAQYKQGHIFQEGLWQKSRHPNLLFELATWIGFATSGIFSAGDVAALVGPFALFLVMDKLTVPITEKYMRKTRGDKYKSFIQSTNKYWPL
jgi:steroid 5-alpha reductase family enzyme